MFVALCFKSNEAIFISTLIIQVKALVNTSTVNPLLFIFQRIEHLKSNSGRKVHLCGKWKGGIQKVLLMRHR